MKRCLIVVDYQNDFVCGSLGFDKAKQLDEPICKKIEEYRKNESIKRTQERRPDLLEK